MPATERTVAVKHMLFKAGKRGELGKEDPRCAPPTHAGSETPVAQLLYREPSSGCLSIPPPVDRIIFSLEATTPRGRSSAWNPGIELTRCGWAYLSDPKGYSWPVYSLKTLLFFWPHKAKHLQVARPGAPVGQAQATPLEFPPHSDSAHTCPGVFPGPPPTCLSPEKAATPQCHLLSRVSSVPQPGLRCFLRWHRACLLPPRGHSATCIPAITAPKYFVESPDSDPGHRRSLIPVPADIPRSLLPLTLPTWSGPAAASASSRVPLWATGAI